MQTMKINRRAIVYLLVAAVILMLVLFGSGQVREKKAEGDTEQPGYSEKRTIRYSFTLQNKTSRFLKDAEFGTYAPVEQTSFQQSQSIETSHPYTLSVDESGNQQLVFKLDLAPLATKIVSVTAHLALSKKSNAMSLSDTESYTGHQKYIETDDIKIRALSGQFTAKEPKQVLKDAFTWVAENINYAGYIEDDRGALYALENKKGDCTEYMYLYAALARSKQIPARGIGGYVVREDAVLKASEFHNWAEIYVDGSWRVVDPQNKKFMQQESSYIAMRIISDNAPKIKDIAPDSHWLSWVSEGIDVEMNN